MDERELSGGAACGGAMMGGILLLLVGAIALSAGPPEEQEVLISSEHIGGKYDASLEYWKIKSRFNESWTHSYGISYTKDGTKLHGYFPQEMRGALDYLRTNTSEGSVVFSWWDYGHAVRGYAEREPVLDGPSESMRSSVADPSRVSHWESGAKVSTVASAFTGRDLNGSIQVVKTYGAHYVMVSKNDALKAWAMFQAAGNDPGQYADGTGLKVGAADTLIYKLLYGQAVAGLDAAYQDADTTIFRVTG